MLSRFLRAVIFAAAALVVSPASGGTIAGSLAPVPHGTSVDLTQVGTMDWVHWGLYTDGSVNRKAGVPVMISNFRVVEASSNAYVVAYQYNDNYNGYTWYDGWPVAGMTNTTTGVWAYQTWPVSRTATGFGFQITVPADTRPRTLHVYVGAFDARGELKATLSDGGSYTDTSLLNVGNGPGGVYSLRYQAGSPGQTLTVRWTLLQRATFDSPQANVTLQAAALTEDNPNNPPLVSLTAPGNFSSFPAPAGIDLVATARDLDGTVSRVEFYQSRESPGGAEGPVSLGQDLSPPYSVPWENSTPGRYVLTAVATDNANASRTSPPAIAYLYTTGGALGGRLDTPPGTVNLTAEGTADWVHLGSSTNAMVVRKNGVTPQLTVTPLGTNQLRRLTDAPTLYSWSDGTPTTSNAGTPTGAFVYGEDNGFRITAPADESPRKLRLYFGGYGIEATLEAFLSDGSAAPFLSRPIDTVYDTVSTFCEIDYSAAGPGRQLVVVLRATQFYDPLWGNVNFQAATLQGAPPQPAPVFIRAGLVDGRIELSFQTEAGRVYAVERKSALSGEEWAAFTETNGTGATVTISDSISSGPQQFYRVITR